jgi:hypothetical protein
MKKRRQLKPLRKFDYLLVAEKMEGFLTNVDRDLQRAGLQALRGQPSHVARRFELLNIIVRFATNSYNAVRYLAGNIEVDDTRKRNYVLIVPAVNRQLLDLLFSLIYMLDDFEERSLQYQRSGWRELDESYRMLKSHFRNDPEWTQHFRNVKGELDKMIVRLAISKDELKNPELIAFWKTPSQLKDEKTTSRSFLRYLAKWLYADTSEQAHLSFAGLAMVGLFLVADIVGGQDEDFVKSRIIHQYHYRHFSRTAFVTLAIATEIDVFCKLGNGKAAAYIWNIFAEYSAEAKEMLEQRYTKLLSSSAQQV